jgi:hypothetical protein
LIQHEKNSQNLFINPRISFCCRAQVKTEEKPSKLLVRAAELELNTPYKAPPGDALSHHTAGFAKIMCSAVFITGLTPEFAAEHVGYFTSP